MAEAEESLVWESADFVCECGDMTKDNDYFNARTRKWYCYKCAKTLGGKEPTDWSETRNDKKQVGS